MSTDQNAAVDVEVTTHVEYLHPGAFVSERTTRPVADRNPVKAVGEAPASAFAFRFFETVSAIAEIEDGAVRKVRVRLGSHEVRPSGTYYIDAERLTAAAVEALPGDHRTLLSNMRSNGWAAVVRCRTGNFQPLLDGDEIIASQEKAR